MFFKLTCSVIFAKKRWTTKSLTVFIRPPDLLLFSLTNRLHDNKYQQWSYLIKLWLSRRSKCTSQNKNWWMKGRYVGCFQRDKKGGCICDITWFTLCHSHSMVRFRHINYHVGFRKNSLFSVKISMFLTSSSKLGVVHRMLLPVSEGWGTRSEWRGESQTGLSNERSGIISLMRLN